MAYKRPIALLRQLDCLFHLVDEVIAGGGDGGSSGPHTHSIANVTGLQAELDGKQPTGSYALTAHNHDGVYQPSGDYAAEDHGHVIANVTGLQAALDGKQESGNYQPAGSYAAATHGHVVGDVTGLQTALDGKQAAGSYAAAAHSHVIADVTGLQAALDGKQASGSYALTSHNHDATYAPISHSHTIANVTGLQTALDGKQASGSYAAASHVHAAGDITSGTLAAARMPALTGDITSSAGAVATTLATVNSNVGSFGNSTTVPVVTVDGKGRVTAVSTAAISGGGGADPWTYIKLGNDFTTSSGTAVAVTGLAFAPAANKHYEFEAKVRLRTATATIGARPGLTWPTGLTDGGVGIWAPNSATAEAIARQPAGVAAVAASTGLPNTTASWPGFISGEVQAGASPSGSVQVTLNAETAGTTVTVKAGSFLRYREIP